MRNDRLTGFTLIEILIVVVILGILASIVIPSVTGAAVDAKRGVLRTLQKQTNIELQRFWQQHGIAPGVDPDSGSLSEEQLHAQLTKYVDLSGRTSETRDGGFSYGPYFDRFPANPISGQQSVQFIGDGEDLPDGDGSHGWIYKPETLEFYADVPGHGLRD